MKIRLPVFLAIVLATTSLAYAQVAPQTLQSGISVFGRGVVRVHADELRFTAFLYPTNNRGTGAAAAPADVDGAAGAIAKALHDAGVADAAASSTGFSMSGPRTVTGSIRKPTRETVEALLRAGNTAAAPFPNVGLQNVAFGLFVDDCSGPEARAQQAALADARMRAERVAHAAGLRLGSIISINEASNFGPNGILNCTTHPDSQFNVTQNIGNIAQRNDGDAALNGDVFVDVTATVVFAIAR